jgi:hypothetical protein
MSGVKESGGEPLRPLSLYSHFLKDLLRALPGGAVSKNVFRQVSGSVDLGTTSQFEGVILGQTAIVLETGASINGRLLAQTAVTLAASAVVEPAL